METLLILESPVSPEDIFQIEKLNKDIGLIISPYDDDGFEPYAIKSYLFQSRVFDQKIYAIFDSNITSEISQVAIRLSCGTQASKNAIILLAFLHLSEVDIEPGISIAEYSTTSDEPESTKKLHDLRKIDNLPPAYLVDIALERISEISLEVSEYQGEPFEFKPFKNAEDVRHWKMYYTFALKIYLLANSDLSKKNKIKALLLWMWKDFLFSAVALTFTCIFFSERYGKMLKGVYSKNERKVLNGIRNAAWDMTIISYWSQKVITRKNDEPHYIFCSADTALKEIAKLLLDQSELVSSQQRLNQLLEHFLSKKEVEEITALHYELDSTMNSPKRKINNTKNLEKYYQTCIDSLEREMGTKIFYQFH